MDTDLVSRIALAKSDKRVLNDIIDDYMPFIRKCVSSAVFDSQSRQDSLTVAMLAFSQSVQTYEPQYGAFFAYAGVVIRNRLIDEARREIKIRKPLFSLSAKIDAGDVQWENDIRVCDEAEERRNLQMEIQAIDAEFAQWGFDWVRLLKKCPKQQRSRQSCWLISQKALVNDRLISEMFNKRQLPIKEIAASAGVSEKTLEKYRQYIVALIIIRQGDYPYIRSFLPQFSEGEGEQ